MSVFLPFEFILGISNVRKCFVKLPKTSNLLELPSTVVSNFLSKSSITLCSRSKMYYHTIWAILALVGFFPVLK